MRVGLVSESSPQEGTPKGDSRKEFFRLNRLADTSRLNIQSIEVDVLPEFIV
jgi:hypothetical protein